MAPDKDRLYLGLYAPGGVSNMEGGEDRYHWAILVGPKIETKEGQGARYHAKEKISQDGLQWVFEERGIPLVPTQMLLIRILIGKVEDMARLVGLLRDTPIRQGEPGWNCVGWAKEAFERVQADGRALGTSVYDWEEVRAMALSYCQRKKDQHRFDGTVSFDTDKAPTYDLIQGRETIE